MGVKRAYPTLSPDHLVLIECGCGHRSMVVLEGGILFPEIRRRGRCRACGHRDVVSTTVMSPNDLQEFGGYINWPDGRRDRYEPGEFDRLKHLWSK